MTKLEQDKKLKEAIDKGFKSGNYFVSATGVPDCLILGSLEIKYTKNKLSEEFKFNGDIVSSGGYGIIYDASTDSWGVLTDEILVGSTITGINARKITKNKQDE